MKNEPFVIERVLNAPADVVWKALTEKAQMKQWYFDIAEFQATAGFEFQFEGGTKDKTFLHKCKIIEVVPGKKLKHSWRYEGYGGNSFVTFELLPEGNKTRIKLTHESLETFPGIPEFAKENFAMGWTDIIGRSLKEFIEKQ